ncbi:rCG58624 [Rattus norvegicus]|uniref:RCG58624 n=1 Tax=Rattus norvegicus TaxID=10116 RepID=A6KR46_RAT|nr:rCG58624 [Rattus norvegicus]
MIVKNITTMTGFLLMGFSDNHELQILQALLFLVTYLLGSAVHEELLTQTELDEILPDAWNIVINNTGIW